MPYFSAEASFSLAWKTCCQQARNGLCVVAVYKPRDENQGAELHREMEYRVLCDAA